MVGSLVYVAGPQIVAECLAGQDPHIVEELQDTELVQRCGRQGASYRVTVKRQLGGFKRA